MSTKFNHQSVPRGPVGTNDLGVEPFGTRFLTPHDLQNIATWENDLYDRSISTKLIAFIAERIARFVPNTLAPNVITATGLVCVMHAYYYTYMYRREWPLFTSAVTVVMFCIYHLCDAIDGIHARNIRNESPLGYVMNQSCDNVAVVFMSVTFMMIMGISPVTQAPQLWYGVHITELIFLWSQLSAFKRGYITYGLFTGPGEAILIINSFVIVNKIVGLDYLYEAWLFLRALLPTDPTAQDGLAELQGVYVVLLTCLIVRCLSLDESNRNTKKVLLICILYRTIPGLLAYAGVASNMTIEHVICDGLFLSMVTTDLVVARMARRDLHDWLLFMATLSLLDKFVIIAIVVFYYCSTFYDICSYMNLPMFTTVKNVYIDGVFDLCHLGHKKHISRALQYGNRLFVGVMSDEDVRKYKRDPIMTTEERCAEVAALRCVYKVIPNAPCFGLDEEFIRYWNIHVVLASPEYDKEDDKYYVVARKLGMLIYMPRTEGVSTSDIIARIKRRDDLKT